MKILQVVPYFPPAYAFGGPVKVAYQISKELVKKGHEVVVHTTDAKDFGSKLEIGSSNMVDGIKVHRFKILSMSLVKKLKLFITPRLILSARKEVETFDIIHLHEYRTFQNAVIRHYAKKYGVPYVLQTHGSLPRIMAWRKLKRLYDIFFGYRLLRDAAKVIALSRVEAEQYKCMGVPEEKIAFIPNGIDLSEYAVLPPKGSFKKKFGIPEEKKIILYLGRIHRIKGIDFLVEAYAHLTKKMNYKDAVLVIAGPDDGYLGEVKTLIKALKIGCSVLVTGPLYGMDKLEAYVDAYVYVLPSRYETFPMTILEAVACGTPVILTENCSIAEFFKGKIGLVVETDPSSLCDALLRLLSSDDIDTFRENCKILARTFDISEVVCQLEKVYEEALSSDCCLKTVD